MKLYIINDGLWHLCTSRDRIDSLFYKEKDYFFCPLCNTKIPNCLTLPFPVINDRQDKAKYISLAKNGHSTDYCISDLNKLNYIEFEI